MTPYDPRHRSTAGSWGGCFITSYESPCGGAFSHERGTYPSALQPRREHGRTLGQGGPETADTKHLFSYKHGLRTKLLWCLFAPLAFPSTGGETKAASRCPTLLPGASWYRGSFATKDTHRPRLVICSYTKTYSRTLRRCMSVFARYPGRG